MEKKTRIFSGKFIAGILIYLVVFLVILAIGLGFFWKFIEAYELSRPKNTLKAYVEQLTPEQISHGNGTDTLYASVDSGIQSRDDFNQVIQQAITEKISYAKKSAESTQDRQVYVLRSGKTPIGQFAIEAGDEETFGFRIWEVTDASFDFSYLMGEPVSITVPTEYQVCFNGYLLDESYITQKDIAYTALEDFYDDYQLPTMVTYTADNYLGEASLEVLDQEGNPVEITPETDMNDFLPSCTDQEAADIEAFANEFVTLWVKFSASTKGNAVYNYYQIKKILSADGALSELLRSAIDGLAYGQTNGAKIEDVIINRIVPLGDGTHMCDLTYLVSTIGKKGTVETSSNMKIIIVTESSGYKLKSMERY